MHMKLFASALICCLLLWTGNVQTADDAATTAPKQSAIADTPKPKVDVFASDLCKKCVCDKDSKQLDCTNASMSTLFTDAQWDILQNGDFIFETIKLEHNNITAVTKFKAYPVVNLYLGFNQIAAIENGAFSDLVNLTKLSLTHNKLTSKALDPEIFQGKFSTSVIMPISSMLELDLGHNELHTLDPDVFKHLPNLEVLVLCENTLQVINHMTEIAIGSLLFLKTLDLSYTELSDIPNNFLHSLRDLETLILSGNLFNEIPEEIDMAVNLKQLVLDENPITNLSNEEVFPKLDNLVYLSVSSMPDLVRIGAGAFSALRKLQVLVLSDNPKLEYIDVNAFSTKTSNPEILDYPPLRKLYLRNNKLNRLERDMLVRWDKVNPIDLSFNPWVCDCTNDWMIHILMAQVNKDTPALTKNVACARPDKWKNALLVDINTNKIPVDCHSTGRGTGSIVLASLLVGILVGIPLTIGGFLIYRRGCFGIRSSRHRRGGDSALYNRAEFSDDFHI